MNWCFLRLSKAGVVSTASSVLLMFSATAIKARRANERLYERERKKEKTLVTFAVWSSG